MQQAYISNGKVVSYEVEEPMRAEIHWMHGNKYTKHWLGYVLVDGGKFTLYQGSGDGCTLGCYRSHKAVLEGVRLEREKLERSGYQVHMYPPVIK
jgi:hypothetical protein